MLRKTCPECGNIIQIDELNYEVGETVKVECQLCGEEIEVVIPELKKEENKEEQKQTTKSEKKEKENQQNNIEKKESKVEKSTSQNTGTVIIPKDITQPVKTETTKSIGYIEENSTSGNGGKTITLIIILLLIMGGIGGYWYYNNVYLPEKIDREAPRFYTMVSSLVLRSTKETGVDYNRVASLPYGTRLIVYENGPEWSRVKVDKQSGEKEEGWVSSRFLLDPAQFKILNSIFGDTNSREIITESRTKFALLDYYNKNNYIGKIDSEERTESGITILPDNSNQWQIFCNPAGSKYNTLKFDRFLDKNQKYQDLAITLQNISTGERKIVLIKFNDDETWDFLGEWPAKSTGNLKYFYVKDNQVYFDYE